MTVDLQVRALDYNVLFFDLFMIAVLMRGLLVAQLFIAIFFAFIFSWIWPEIIGVEAMLLGVTCVAVVRAVVVANNFRAAARYAPKALLAPLGWRGIGRLYFGELCATLISSSWSMPFQRLCPATTNVSAGIPVLLIHGYGCNSGYWRPLSRHLDAA